MSKVQICLFVVTCRYKQIETDTTDHNCSKTMRIEQVWVNDHVLMEGDMNLRN